MTISHIKPADVESKLRIADAKCSRRNRRFTPVTRQLCLQHHACGFGYKKISKATGIPISTIKYHVRKERDSVGADDAHEAGAAAVVATQSASPSLRQKMRVGFEKSTALVAMMHAVHDVMRKNVYAFARALQHDTHGAPGVMNAADPHMLTLALSLLLHDQWAERQELAALGRILLQRLYNARDFLRSAISLCHEALSETSSSVAATGMACGIAGHGVSPAGRATYWECPVCSKRLVHTGKCAHQTRCLRKCRVALSHEQLQAAKATAAACVAQSESPEELKQQLAHVLALRGDDSKSCFHQVRYMQLVVATNASLQQDVDAAPAAILESRDAWRTLQSGPNPVIAALALVSLALNLQSHGKKKKEQKALVDRLAREFGGAVAERIAAVETFLKRCVDTDAPSPAAVDARDLPTQEDPRGAAPAPPCTCYRVRISALLHP